jgi:hypothetical protein
MSTPTVTTTQSNMISLTMQEASLQVIQGSKRSICSLQLKASIPPRRKGQQKPNYLIPNPQYDWPHLPPFSQLAIIANHSTTQLLRTMFQQKNVSTNHPFWIRFFDYANRDDFGRIAENNSTNDFGGRMATNGYINITSIVLPLDTYGQFMICYVDGKPVVSRENDDMTNDRECWEIPFHDFVAKYGRERLLKLGLYMTEELIGEWTKRVADFKSYFLFIRTFKAPVCPGHMIVNDWLGRCSVPTDIEVKLQIRSNTQLIDYSFLHTIGRNKPMKVGPRTLNQKTGVMERLEAIFSGEGEVTVIFYVEDTAENPFTHVSIDAEIVGMDIIPFEQLVVNYSDPMEITDPSQLVTTLWSPRKIASILGNIMSEDYVEKKKALYKFMDENPDFMELFNQYKDGKCPALPFLTHDKHDNPSVQFLISRVKETVPSIYTLVQNSLVYDLLINRDEAIKAMVAKDEEIRKAERLAALERDEELASSYPPIALPQMSYQMSDASPFVESPNPASMPQFKMRELLVVPSCGRP